MGRQNVTVGCGAGFAGDRIEPAVELASSGLVDWVALECLAERTLVGGLMAREADPGRGFDPRLVRRLTPLLPAAADSGCGIVTNMGAANPIAAGTEVVKLYRRLGMSPGRVAVVTGDDISSRLADVDWDGGAPDGGEWIGVHAYLGVSGISEAVAGGATVVVTGRVADSALFAAPVNAHLELEEDGLAGALTAGHLLECGGQLTGGNLTAAGRDLDASDLAALGYPMATVRADGTGVLSVLANKPARLDPVACTLQLLYEVHDPARYLTPDVALDFTSVRFEELSENRVAMNGARAAGRPASLKAVGFYRKPGAMADVEIGFAGSGALSRAGRAADVLCRRLEQLRIEFAVDIVGVDSILGVDGSPPGSKPAEVRVHTSARCPSAEIAQAVEDEVFGLTLTGPAGGCALRSERRPRVEVVSGTIHRDLIDERVEFLEP